MSIQIRSAVSEDLPVLMRFEQALIDAERPFDPSLKLNTYYYDLPYMIQSDHIEIAVAETNSEIIGSGYVRIESAKHYLKHTQHGYFGFMYVLPSYRGKGVNIQMMEYLFQWTRKKGIHECRLDVYADNSAAIKAYAKAGFAAHMLHMRKEL